MNIFPAAPGTYVLNASAERIAVIVGWTHVQGALVFPMFVTARSGILKSEAIEHEDGTVSYPAGPALGLFESPADWESYASEHNLAKATGEAVQAPPAPTVEKVTTHPTTAKINPEPTADPNSPIEFGTKTFKTKSFWHWPAANAIFEIEGEAVIPNDSRVVKIKRDEYFEFKRQKNVDVIDPHSGAVADADEPAAEDDMDVV